jgi:UDP-2,3-diacylglucosamine hydrolase
LKRIAELHQLNNLQARITLNPSKKIFFLSDFHLGAPTAETSLLRERKIVYFLDQIKNETEQLFILGDLFDFWFEYKYVVPKGYVRILGKLAELSDMGIPIHFFVGNHDMWMKDYLQKEINAHVYFHPKTFVLHGKKMLIGHGDGLGPGDHGYKFIKKIFRNPICITLFGLLPPRIGIGIANYMSRRSRAKTGNHDKNYLGDDKEFLVQYCKSEIKKEAFDFFIFGHRHLPLDIKISPECRYINLGDWIDYMSYAEYNNGDLSLHYFEK